MISIRSGYATFGSKPYLISIGDDVTIAGGVQFITHDGRVWIFNSKTNEMGYPDNIDVCGRIDIGTNVLVGFGVILMPNISIGDNVVIGAGAVVTGDTPSDSVAVGVPAKVIMTKEQYKEKVFANSCNIRTLSYEEKRKYLLERYS